MYCICLKSMPGEIAKRLAEWEACYCSLYFLIECSPHSNCHIKFGVISRFLELGSILEPGRPPKTDKAAILADAIRMVTQLRSKAQKLKESNEDLQVKIKELKVGLFWSGIFLYLFGGFTSFKNCSVICISFYQLSSLAAYSSHMYG